MQRFPLIISVILAVVIGLATPVSSQELGENLASDSVLYKKTMAGGLNLHTLGYGIQFQKGKNITVFKNFYWELMLVEMKSSKQIKSINPYFTNAKSYVYGKLNNVYMLRGGVGHNRLLNRKPYFGGIELRYTYSGGITLGIAKPVYLYIIDFTSNPYEYEITTEKYDPDEHFYDNIYGRAPFTKGFDQIRVYPGIYVKAGLDFEFGSYKSKINSLVAGGIIEYYPKGIPIMAFIEPKNLFLTLFISYSFGKRYNKY